MDESLLKEMQNCCEDILLATVVLYTAQQRAFKYQGHQTG